jgi:hypothetical protein
VAMYSIEAQRFGLKKETVRGTAETTPDKWYPVLKGTELTYGLSLLENDVLKGDPTMLPPVAGGKSGSGKVKLPLDSQTCVEFFRGLLGGLSSAQQGATAAYKHTITLNAGLQKPPYTFFLDYGIDVKKYSLGTVKKVMIGGAVDSLGAFEADVLFKAEASGAIGSPTFPTQKYLAFQTMDFKIAGASSTDIKEWNIEIDNGAIWSSDAKPVTGSHRHHRPPGKIDIKGGFTAYFQNETERAKFLANTAVALRMLATGPLIASTYYNTVDINIYEAHYTAFPFGDDAGLLAAKATFTGYYSASDSKAIQIDVTNSTTSY